MVFKCDEKECSFLSQQKNYTENGGKKQSSILNKHKDISMIGDAHHTPFHMVRSTPLGVETADR